METITMLKVVHRNTIEEPQNDATIECNTIDAAESDIFHDTYDYFPDFGI
jgi:hypothetical protein